jgi:hypothetical protein
LTFGKNEREEERGVERRRKKMMVVYNATIEAISAISFLQSSHDKTT